MPDLIVIDGGKGQLHAAHDALTAMGLGDVPLISLAKKEEEVFLVGRSESLRLSRRSPGLRLLQQARDEAHRFAITYNRKRRSMRTVTSELLKVPGIGPNKRRLLLQTFGSVQGVMDASVEEIARLPGFGAASAQRLLDALHGVTRAQAAEATHGSEAAPEDATSEVAAAIQPSPDVAAPPAASEGAA